MPLTVFRWYEWQQKYLKIAFMVSCTIFIFSIFGMAFFFEQTEYYIFRNIAYIFVVVALVSAILDVRISD